MKTKLLLQNEGYRNVHSWDEEFEPEIVRLNEELEQQLAERTAEVRKQTDQLRAMATELAHVEQRERGRLATILHDNLQQLLVAARIQISIVNAALLPVTERNALSRANKIISEAIADSRTLTIDLSPPILHGAGLGVALEWLVARMAELHFFTVDLTVDHRVEPRSESLRVLLFETVRELLLNSCKHSGGARARVEITREQDSWVRVVVEDAGVGFDSKALSASLASGTGLGLFRIQQRLADAGARMALASKPGVGTRVEIMARIEDRVRVDDRRPARRVGLEFGRENAAEVTIGVLVADGRKVSSKSAAASLPWVTVQEK
jgi:signal transduction histidine kinase